MLENPQVATNLIYNYRGTKIKGAQETKQVGILFIQRAKL